MAAHLKTQLWTVIHVVVGWAWCFLLIPPWIWRGYSLLPFDAPHQPFTN